MHLRNGFWPKKTWIGELSPLCSEYEKVEKVLSLKAMQSCTKNSQDVLQQNFLQKSSFITSGNFFVSPHEHCSERSHRIVLERKTALFTCCPLEGKAIGKSIHLSQVVQRSTAPWDHGFAIPSHELLKPVTRSCVGPFSPNWHYCNLTLRQKAKVQPWQKLRCIKKKIPSPLHGINKTEMKPCIGFLGFPTARSKSPLAALLLLACCQQFFLEKNPLDFTRFQCSSWWVSTHLKNFGQIGSFP